VSLSNQTTSGYEAAENSSHCLCARPAASLGGFETPVLSAAMWSLQLTAERWMETGINDSLVRVSVGLEGERDLIADFKQSLDG
jgi:cystathionine beta-lyase/cystathionine gamma-synthase